MLDCKKTKVIKWYGKYLFFAFVLIITLTYITTNDGLTTFGEALKNPTFQRHIEDSKNEKTTPNSESNIKYAEAEVDLKVSVAGMQVGRKDRKN